jgi:hypothetical protein
MPSHPGLGTRRDGVASGFGGNRNNHAYRYSWQVTQCHSDCDRYGKFAQDCGREETTRLGSCIPAVSTPAGLRDLAVHGDAAAIARGVTAPLDAGADHVAARNGANNGGQTLSWSSKSVDFITLFTEDLERSKAF